MLSPIINYVYIRQIVSRLIRLVHCHTLQIGPETLFDHDSVCAMTTHVYSCYHLQ